MAEQPIQRQRETWFVTNVSNNSIRITDIPSIPVISPSQRIDLLSYTSLSIAQSSTVISAYISNKILSPEEYLHTHDDRAEAIHKHILTDVTDVDATVLEINQALDGIGSTVTDINLTTLTNSSNADDLHTHEGTGGVSIHNELDGLNDGDYKHLTSDEKIDFNSNTSKRHDELHTVASHTDTTATGSELNTLTDGSNADLLHTHSGSGSTPDHDDLNGLNTGEYQHLTSAEKDNFDILTDGSIADLLHKHNHDNLTGLVGDEHINHANVDIIAGTGLSGGGAINASISLSLDIDNLTVDTNIGDTDTVPFYDGANKKITFANLMSTSVTRSEWAQNGFDDVNGDPGADVSISWDDSSQELTISPTGASFDYYLAGVKYTETGILTKTLTADETGLWVFYISSEGVIATAKNPSHDAIDNVIKNYAIIAYVYWNTDIDDGRLMWEVHGCNMSPSTHHYLHDNVGAVYSSGMIIADTVIDGNGDNDEDAEMSVASGCFYDEDISHNTIGVPVAGEYETWYLNGTDWEWHETPADWQASKSYSTGDRVLAVPTLPVDTNNASIRGLIFEVTDNGGTSAGTEPIWQDASGAVDADGGDPCGAITLDADITWTCVGSTRSPVINYVGGDYRLAWNDAGTQTESTNNDFILSHIFATNVTEDDGTSPKYIAIQGQDRYLTGATARAGADVEINNLVYGSLPLQEIVPVGTLIYQTSNGYDNHSKSRLRPTSSGDHWVDWRSSNLKASGGSIADHGGLSGLSDDDHAQYLLLAGRDGQTIEDDITFPTNNNIYLGDNQETFITYDGTDLLLGFSDPSASELTQQVRINDDLTIDGLLTIGTSSIQIDGDNSVITSTIGTISFDDENLTTTGTVTADKGVFTDSLNALTLGDGSVDEQVYIKFYGANGDNDYNSISFDVNAGDFFIGEDGRQGTVNIFGEVYMNGNPIFGVDELSIEDELTVGDGGFEATADEVIVGAEDGLFVSKITALDDYFDFDIDDDSDGLYYKFRFDGEDNFDFVSDKLGSGNPAWEFYVPVLMSSLPTSDPSVAGQLWRDGTDLKVSI